MKFDNSTVYPLPPEYPKTLGVEFSGIVHQSHSQDWKKGDAIFGLAYGVSLDHNLGSTPLQGLEHVRTSLIGLER